MKYSIHFAEDLFSLPSDVRARIAEVMENVAAAAVDIPSTSPFWASLRGTLLQIVASGWGVGYRLDPDSRRLEVVYATPPARRTSA